MLLKSERVRGIKGVLWPSLEAGFGRCLTLHFCLCADVTPAPPVQQQENKSHILPPWHNRALLGLIFSQCVFAERCAHTHSPQAAQNIDSGLVGAVHFTWYFNSCRGRWAAIKYAAGHVLDLQIYLQRSEIFKVICFMGWLQRSHCGTVGRRCMG